MQNMQKNHKNFPKNVPKLTVKNSYFYRGSLNAVLRAKNGPKPQVSDIVGKLTSQAVCRF